METPTKNLIFVGFMGTGKSTTARRISQALSWEYVSTDALIEEKEGILIDQLFKEKGEEYFRRIESEVLAGLKPHKPTVVDGGGGIILKEENRKRLKSLGIVILMMARPPVIEHRVSKGSNRPVLDGPGPILDRIRKLLADRASAYESVADYRVDSSDLSEDGVADLIKLIARKENLI